MLNSGTILQNRYQIIQRIGGGGMGDVYLAADLRLANNRVVVKENRGGDAHLFYTEAALLATLRHPGLPSVTDHWVEPATNAQYLVMTYIAGQTLEQVVQTRGMLNEQDAHTWMFQVLEAVQYLHTNRIIHRDIKPQNIIITPDGKAILVDFGIAKVMQPGRATVSGARGLGSPGYAPLEQYYGGTDERTDVYSLGATLYFTLTATEPPSAPERANGKPLMSARQLNGTVSASTDTAIQTAMALQGAQRFPNVAAMEYALRATIARTVPAPTSFNPLLVGGGIALAAIIAFGLMLFAFNVLRGTEMPTPNTVAIAPTATRAPVLPTTTSLPAPAVTERVIVVTATPIPTPTPTATPRFTPTPRAGEIRVFAPDNAPMAFVPAGEFLMGSSDADKDADSDEKPQHTVYLDAFWIDRFEVTNASYRLCVDAGKCARPSQTKSYTRDAYYGNSQYDNYPVIYVDWNRAKTYCDWAGKRLPTEAEWEKAARGMDSKIYPWGNSFEQSRLNSNSVVGDTSQVGKYPSGASSYGVMDMAGNVWEWVADWYDDKYYANSPRNNPTGPTSGSAHALRGGAWYDVPQIVRTAFRNRSAPTNSNDVLGFRCARGF